MSLASLSPELIEKILNLLPIRDILRCRLLNRYVHSVYHGSFKLRYKASLSNSGFIDNEFSTLSVADKRIALAASHNAWIHLAPILKYRIDTPFVVDFNVSLSEGMLYVINMNTAVLPRDDGLEFCDVAALDLARKSDGNGDDLSGRARWKISKHSRVADGSPRFTCRLELATSLYEHDIYAEAHSSWNEPNATVFMVSICLYRYSDLNGRPRERPKEVKHIWLMNSRTKSPQISLQISGKHVVVLLSSGQIVHVFIYDFISDVLLMAFRVPLHTYDQNSIVFLDESTLLFPNSRSGKLDIFRIPERPTFEPVAPFLSLNLPTLSPNISHHSITCTADPIPLSERSYFEFGGQQASRHSNSLRSTLRPEKGFLKDAKASLCIFTFEIELDLPDQSSDDDGRPYYFTLVVHRSALLKVIALYTDPLPPPSSNQNTGQTHQYQWHTLDDSSMRMRDPLTRRIHINPEKAHVQETRHISRWVIPSAPRSVSWDDWGPPITRWFNHENMPAGDTTKGWGERCVRLPVKVYPRIYGSDTDDSESGPEGQYPYIVLDFRQQTISATWAMLSNDPTMASDVVEAVSLTENTLTFHQSIISASSQTTTSSNTRIENWRRSIGPTGVHVEPKTTQFCGEVVDYLRPNQALLVNYTTPLLDNFNIFRYPVVSSLPYLARASRELVNWSQVLMDDERLVGYYIGDEHHSVQVRQFN
ncbi:hypothetical protein BDN70DRAFT_929689 [Pholiota conissans]|uniref:F-box domain-containing protein n=1 Tax=Pholiota conissans TaxID=109636 RepID=A0A9P5Z9V9_9AGAR|nr:hypothetical protein BDN70DRAFT_929689 [Pholiota conissans]